VPPKQSPVWFILLALTGCARPSDAGPSPATMTGPSANHRASPAVITELEPRPASAPATEPPKTPKSSGFQPATRSDGGCTVRVRALLGAEEYRGGGPMTPALEASLAADPDYARMYASESHGDHHIQCHYEVVLAGRPGERFRWREVHSNTLRDLGVEVCETDIAEVAQRILDSTQQCTDLAAKAYWGDVLEPW
jgi:hypothetical protein